MKKKSSVDLESCITAAVLVIMLTLVFLGVVSRYVLHFSFSFTEELVCALFVLLGTVGSALACKRRSLYTLDLLTGTMKPKMKTIFSIITTTLTCLAALFLFWTSFFDDLNTAQAQEPDCRPPGAGMDLHDGRSVRPGTGDFPMHPEHPAGCPETQKTQRGG